MRFYPFDFLGNSSLLSKINIFYDGWPGMSIPTGGPGCQSRVSYGSYTDPLFHHSGISTVTGSATLSSQYFALGRVARDVNPGFHMEVTLIHSSTIQGYRE